MEVIAVGKAMLATTPCDLRSHHLGGWVDYWFSRGTRRNALDVSIFSGSDPEIIGYPDDTLDSSFMGQTVCVFQIIWRGIGPGDVKNSGLFLLAASEEMRGV
jgi:hypothetical protein